MRLRIREEHRAMPAYEKPPAWRVDVYLGAQNVNMAALSLRFDKELH